MQLERFDNLKWNSIPKGQQPETILEDNPYSELSLEGNE